MLNNENDILRLQAQVAELQIQVSGLEAKLAERREIVINFKAPAEEDIAKLIEQALANHRALLDARRV